MRGSNVRSSAACLENPCTSSSSAPGGCAATPARRALTVTARHPRSSADHAPQAETTWRCQSQSVSAIGRNVTPDRRISIGLVAGLRNPASAALGHQLRIAGASDRSADLSHTIWPGPGHASAASRARPRSRLSSWPGNPSWGPTGTSPSCWTGRRSGASSPVETVDAACGREHNRRG